MVNLVESLFGLAIVAGVVAIVCRALKQRARSRRVALVAAALGTLAGALELWLRIAT